MTRRVLSVKRPVGEMIVGEMNATPGEDLITPISNSITDNTKFLDFLYPFTFLTTTNTIIP